jgi:hypothetical protein
LADQTSVIAKEEGKSGGNGEERKGKEKEREKFIYTNSQLLSVIEIIFW